MRLAFLGGPAIVIGMVLAGCAVGPDYHRPDVKLPQAYRELPIEWQAAMPAQVASDQPWWKAFNDAVLDDLESRIDLANQTLQSALFAYNASQEALRASQGGFWPTLTVGAGETRSARGTASTVNLKSASASASWELDLWGRIRRSVEASKATSLASADDLAATRLSLQSALATDYFELRVQEQIQQLLDTTVNADRQALQIAENRYRAGVAARADVVTAQTQLLGVQAQQLNAEILRAQLEHAIAVLVGEAPSEFHLGKAQPLLSFPQVPVGIPSSLLQRRPDIAAAERRMAAANAQIGIAKAAYFPTLSLGSNLSYTNSLARQLFSLPNRVWSVGPAVSDTLFDGLARQAKTAQARATHEQSVAVYRQAVLAALQQVEDDLVGLRVLGEQASVEDELLRSAHLAESLTLNQYKAGTAPYSSVIAAQTATLSAEQTALQVVRNRLTTTVALIAALGGGWDGSRAP